MAEKELSGELEKFSYSLGMSIAGNLIQSGVKTVNPELCKKFFEGTFFYWLCPVKHNLKTAQINAVVDFRIYFLSTKIKSN